MVEIGEKASNLSEQLRLLRDLYEEETAQRIEFFTGLVGLLSKVLTVSIMPASISALTCRLSWPV